MGLVDGGGRENGDQSGHIANKQRLNMLSVSQTIFKLTNLWESAKRNNDGVVS